MAEQVAHVVRVGINEIILAAVASLAMTSLFVLCSQGEGDVGYDL